MDFDPSTAKEIGFEYSFDPSTAKPVEAVTFDPSTARPVHDWGTTDARDHRATYVSPPVKNSNTLFSEGSLDRTRLAAESAISVHPLLGRSIGAMEAAEAKRRRAYIANKEMEDTPENRKGIADLEAAHADKVAKYILLRNGLNEDMLAANPSFMENLVGAIGPGLIDPLNIVPISQGKTATQAALKGLAAGVGFGVAGTYEQGAFDRSIGLNKDDPTVKELLEAGVDSGVIVAALSVLTHRFGKPQVKKESVVDSIEADAKAYIEKKASPTKDVDTSNARAPQYLGKKSPATIATENRASDYAAKEGIPYEPATGTLDLKDARGRYDPDFFDTSELAAAEAKANRAAQATSNLPQAADVMVGIPDVRDGNITSPNMTPEELVRAQSNADKTSEPAHSVMEIPEEMGQQPYWPDKALEAAKVKANKTAELSSAFLKAASKKQGGAIDLTQFTGPGFRDLADTVKQSADNLWNMVPDGYKVIFKGAYWADEKGTPSPLFHSTNALEEGTRFTHKEKAFGKYDPRRGDGMLIHVGTPDAAEIKNNYFARTEQNYKTLDGATINFDSLQSRMDAAGLHGDDPFSNSPTIKAVRDQWYADMSAKMELGRSKDTQLFYTSLLKLKEEIKQSGTKNYYDKVLVRKGTSAAQEAVMEAAGIGPDTLRSMLKDIKESGVSDVADALGRRLETRALATIPYKWSSKSNTHVRPMFSSAKNPLFVKDFGNWESPAQIADYLATVPKKDIDGMREQFHKKSKMSVLHPKDILGPEKFAEFQREMRKLSDDFIEQGASEQQNKRVQNFERLYGTLERYGFDHFASENQFERLHPAFQNKATAAEADIPSISLAFWDPKYLHDWADVPRQKQPFVPKSQRGSLNVGEIAKGVSEQYDNAADLLKAFKGKLTDIPFSKKLLPITANQAGEWFKNPLIEWTYNYLRRIDNTIDVRANYNKAYLKDVIDFFKRDRNGALDMVNTLVKIQEPELKAARQWAEDNNAREAFLKEHGMPDHQIPHAIKILNVMKATGLHDQETAYKLREHNFHMEPMYFPKEHTGPFTVYVTKPDGTVVHAQPFDHIVGAREYEKAFKKAAEGQDLIVSLERNEAGTLGNTYAILNQSADQLPEFLRDLNKNLLKEIEIRKRKFEMERSAENVTGATGESIYHSSSEFLGLVKRPGKWQFDQDQRALSLLQRRLEQSYALEKTARIIKEIKEPLLDDPFALVDKDGNRMSELTTYLHQLLAREQGLDISKIQQLQRDSIDAAMNSFGKQVDRVAGMSRGYKGGDISYFKPNEVARVIQAYTWFMSVVKLGWSIPVLAANASTALITPIDGFRTAAREGISQTISLLAGQKAMLAPFDADAIKWLHQADLEGMVEPRISDPMTFVETHTRSAMDKAVNFARDAIEKKTNQAALMYYYNFYKLAYPELSPNSAAFKTKVYKAARSWTGDYTSSAQLMQLSQLGYVGQLHSNFAKWKYNQIGRLANDIQMLGEGNIVPFAITMGVGVLLAGAIGAPIMAEYEALRRLLFTVSGGSIDWKPFPEFLYDSREWIRKNMGEGPAKIAQSLERGPISYGASQLGDMPDLSNSLRYSSLMDVSTLPFSFGGDLYKGMNVSLKALWNIAQRENITQQQAKDITKMLPVVVGKPVNELVENRIQTGAWFKPGYVKQFSTQDRGKYRRTPAEKAMAFAGFTSYNENTFGDRITGKEWNDRRVKTLIGKQVDRMVSNLNHPHVLQDAAEKIFEEKGITGVEAAIQAVIKQKQENQMSYLEQELAKSINITDPIAKAKILEALKKFQPAK